MYLLLFALACKPSVPKPFVKREGQTEVVGDQGPSRTPRSGDADGSGAPLPRNDGDPIPPGGILPPNVTHVAPAVSGDLPPVPDNCDDLLQSKVITACPAGTVLADERQTQARMYCTLPNHVRHGPYIDFHNNGQPKDVGPYVGGLRHGWWTEWSRDGALLGRWRWEAGAPVEGKVQE